MVIDKEQVAQYAFEIIIHIFANCSGRLQAAAARRHSAAAAAACDLALLRSAKRLARTFGERR